MENTLENKAKFFAQYWGQEVMVLDGLPSTVDSWFDGSNVKVFHLLLKPLSSITDEDIIHVAMLAHQRPDLNFKVKRNKDIIYAETEFDKVGIRYFISILLKYGTVCAKICFSKTKTEEYKQSTVNIGQISISSARPVPYIAIVDYLRDKGYALQFNGLSVECQVEYGWVKLKP